MPKGMNRVQEAVKLCIACTQRKAPKQNLGLMASRPPTHPWHTVVMDFCGPYGSTRQGNKYVLVFVDHFTKWVELYPTKDQLATTVVEEFYKNIICRHGAPLRLLSDNGPQYRAATVVHLCHLFGINKIFASTY